MNTSIFISSDPQSYDVTCHLKGPLFTDDIWDLASVLQEQIWSKDLSVVKWVHIDITRTQDNLFKPYRLFNLCSHFQTKFISNNFETKLCLVANKTQGELFGNFDDILGFNVKIVDSSQIHNEVIEEEEYYYEGPKDYDFNREAVKIMWDWLKNHEDSNDKRYFISGREMSARDIFEEVQRETEIGKEYINSIIEIGFKYGLKISKG